MEKKIESQKLSLEKQIQTEKTLKIQVRPPTQVWKLSIFSLTFELQKTKNSYFLSSFVKNILLPQACIELWTSVRKHKYAFSHSSIDYCKPPSLLSLRVYIYHKKSFFFFNVACFCSQAVNKLSEVMAKRKDQERGGIRIVNSEVHKTKQENRKLQQDLKAERQKINSILFKHQKELEDVQAVSAPTTCLKYMQLI